MGIRRCVYKSGRPQQAQCLLHLTLLLTLILSCNLDHCISPARTTINSIAHPETQPVTHPDRRARTLRTQIHRHHPLRHQHPTHISTGRSFPDAGRVRDEVRLSEAGNRCRRRQRSRNSNSNRNKCGRRCSDRVLLQGWSQGEDGGAVGGAGWV